MQINCKSCNHLITKESRFCSNCGAKIVEDRLSLKGTWEEFVGPFFSWENNFWRTFFGMFKNPKEVLEAYICGARKKYFQPFSYIILFATIAVFFYKLFPIEVTEAISNNIAEGNNISLPRNNNFSIDMKSYMDFTMSYYNFMLISFLPIYALISFFVFKKKGHNFFEHLVFNCYIQTNIGYIILLLQLIMLNIFNFNFIIYSYLSLLLTLLYSFFTFRSLYQLNIKQSISSILRFVLYTFLFLIIIGIICFLIGLIIGVIILMSKKS